MFVFEAFCELLWRINMRKKYVHHWFEYCFIFVCPQVSSNDRRCIDRWSDLERHSRRGHGQSSSDLDAILDDLVVDADATATRYESFFPKKLDRTIQLKIFLSWTKRTSFWELMCLNVWMIFTTVPLTSGPPSGGSPSVLATGVPPSSLEQLLVERAKAIRQANPALKALADIQGKIKVWRHFRHSGFPN